MDNFMKIHFVTAVAGDNQMYQLIVRILEKAGHKIITKHYLTRRLSEIDAESQEDSRKYSRNSKKWMQKADLVVFETTLGDVSVGYELALAVQSCKPIIALYQNDIGNVPYSLKGVLSEKIQMFAYDKNTLEDLLVGAIDYAQSQIETRFNLFLTQETKSYLNWISSHKKVPKSVFVRDLIIEKLESDDLYKASLT